MNEKRQRKLTIEQQQDHWTLNPVENFHVNETPIDYLSHTNATGLIKHAVHTLLQNRPEDPIQFLADYFAPTDSNSVETAYEKLSWAHYSSSVYQRNVLQVYDTLTTSKNEGTTLKGLLGQQFNGLLGKLCDELPHKYSQHVFLRVKKKVDHVITFNTFYRDVLMLHVLKDFIQIVKETFNDLDIHASGKASLKLCNLVLDNLFVSVIQAKPTFMNDSISTNHHGGSKREQTQTHELDKAFSRLFIKSADSAHDVETMTVDDFVHESIVRFLKKL